MFALQILARIGDPAAAPAVLPLMRHPHPNVAQAAIEALGRLASREAVPALLELFWAASSGSSSRPSMPWAPSAIRWRWGRWSS